MDVPPEVQKAWPGALGALIALPFLAGTLPARVAMVAGGVALSYWGTPTAAIHLGVTNAEGLVGFLIGLFGMSVVAKLHEVLASLKAELAVGTLMDWIRKNLGV
jgi:hypothetical protein